MSAKKQQPTTVAADDPDDLKGTLKRIGGSQSDHWNNVIGDQALQSLWIKHSDKEARDRQCGAAIAGLIGIGPKDEIEGMIAAQLIAAHNAAMECYRRAMIGEQTFEGRRENLAQANKLSRTYAVLLDALNRHRGKGQQKVTVEHVHVHAGGRAVVGTVETPGGGDRKKSEEKAANTSAPSIDPLTLVGLRDRALIGVMTYAFARVGAVVAMRVEDYFANGKRWWVRLHEKGGKRP
jgi:hypothetical protein